MKIETLLANNKKWARKVKRKNPKFFSKLSCLQKPKFLWIGCSDSRVPANEITGLLSGEVFVHRNVANLVYRDDLNCVSVLRYAVDVLKVKYVIVCGHYDCGGIKAVVQLKRLGKSDAWLKSIHEVLEYNSDELKKINQKTRQIDRLCELNVLKQAQNVYDFKFIKNALKEGRLKSVHAWIYDLRDGLLKELKAYR